MFSRKTTVNVIPLALAAIAVTAFPPKVEASFGLRRTWRHVEKEVHRWFDPYHREETIGAIVKIVGLVCELSGAPCTLNALAVIPPTSAQFDAIDLTGDGLPELVRFDTSLDPARLYVQRA